MWSPEGVSLRPRTIPYDFGSVTTRRRFSQVTRIIPILETLVAVIDSRVSWSKIRQNVAGFKRFYSARRTNNLALSAIVKVAGCQPDECIQNQMVH